MGTDRIGEIGDSEGQIAGVYGIGFTAGFMARNIGRTRGAGNKLLSFPPGLICLLIRERLEEVRS